MLERDPAPFADDEPEQNQAATVTVPEGDEDDDAMIDPVGA